MSITINTVAFTLDTFLSPNKVTYTTPAHSVSNEDTLTLGRTDPKPSGTFRGVMRAEARRAKTVTLDDLSKAVAIITTSVSLPVGVSEADVDAIRDDLGDFLISAEGKKLLWNRDINQ